MNCGLSTDYMQIGDFWGSGKSQEETFVAVNRMTA